MDERSDFVPQASLREGLLDRSEKLMKEVDGRLRVELVVTPFGMPRRWRPRRAPAR